MKFFLTEADMEFIKLRSRKVYHQSDRIDSLMIPVKMITSGEFTKNMGIKDNEE